MEAETATGLNDPIDPLLSRLDDTNDPNPEEVADLFRGHCRRLVGLAFAITFDAGVAEEVVQDAFVGLQRNSTRVRDPLAYLQRSVVNLSVSVVRRRGRLAHRPAALMAEPASSPEIDEM